MQALEAFDSPRRATRGAVAYLSNRLNNRWPKGQSALPPKRESIFTSLLSNIQGHGFIRAGTLREKRTGFTGCGKTHLGQHIRQFCNKGTASAGPKRVAKNGPALAAEGCFWDEETSLRA
jgi:hypothetical protein